MLETPLSFDGGTIVVNGETVAATCGPERTEPLSEFEATTVVRKKIVGATADLPHLVRQAAVIDGVEWEVERASVVGEVAVVTYMRNAD